MLSLKQIIALSLLWLIPMAVVAQASEVPSSADKICPLLIGSPVPEVTLTTGANTAFDLNAALGKKPTILIFYRGGW